MPDEKSCGIVLFSEDGGRLYLLLHYTAGHWDFPKGHVEADESEAETALRELLEETG
ncbi:MAG: NUDIX domain-containing protein, partial [Candidatus Micrarchaeota archaeon]